MTIKKETNVFDIALKNLDSIRINPIINKKETDELLLIYILKMN